MDVFNCIKHLDFISQECEKYLNKKNITDEDLISLIVELERFQEKYGTSELPPELRTKISELSIDYTIKGLERRTWFTLAAFITLGTWTVFLNFKEQKKRAQALKALHFDISVISAYVRLNY